MNRGGPSKRIGAQLDGSVYYFTGEPCVNGHVDLRYNSNGDCMVCERNYVAYAATRPRGPNRKARHALVMLGMSLPIERANGK